MTRGNRLAGPSVRPAVFVTYTVLWVPFFYIERYANNIWIHGNLAFSMLIILNAASLLRWNILPFIADMHVFACLEIMATDIALL